MTALFVERSTAPLTSALLTSFTYAQLPCPGALAVMRPCPSATENLRSAPVPVQGPPRSALPHVPVRVRSNVSPANGCAVPATATFWVVGAVAPPLSVTVRVTL